ncbi:conserved hypothetical protein [Ricinus communis]|uniref:Uncharacterized protein n=1 Tax=Ricinus communis TaxID=3988 RepID=B9T3S7_RICCO|nr:conserved hypothetical protein [Ricinus communis]
MRMSGNCKLLIDSKILVTQSDSKLLIDEILGKGISDSFGGLLVDDIIHLVPNIETAISKKFVKLRTRLHIF